MDTLRVFDDEWTELAPRLSMVLAGKGVHPQDRDDLLQETALRLYRVWETLAPDQPVWPFAVTIALNLWRDQVRASVVRQRDVLSANLGDGVGELAASYDVERTVLARHELAQVGAVMRSLEPEQRRLLLENDEVSAVVSPLRPAERMARMRARRELARVVGRASAAIGLFLWRRPLRSSACATAACAGMLAAAVMSSTPMIWTQPDMPQVALRPVSVPDVAVVAPHFGHAATLRAGHAVAVVPTSFRQPLVPTAPKTQLCAPTTAGSPHRANTPVISIGSGGLYVDDGSGQQPILETPAMSADSAGCVHVG